MPLFNYHCANCLRSETRVGGIDDLVACCGRCGRPMRRRRDLQRDFLAYG